MTNTEALAEMALYLAGAIEQGQVDAAHDVIGPAMTSAGGFTHQYTNTNSLEAQWR